MNESAIFWQYLSLGLGVIASMLSIINHLLRSQIKDLKASLKQSQEQFQQVALNITQKVPILEKDKISAVDLLKEKFPKMLFYSGSYALVAIGVILILHFLPRLIDPSKVIIMSFGSWLLLVILGSIFLSLPYLIYKKILESLKGISITNLKIHLEPPSQKGEAQSN